MEDVVIIGGGGYAKVVISILKKLRKYNIVGYTDENDNGELLGVKYLGNDNILKKVYRTMNVQHAVLGIGQLQDATLKKKVVLNAEKIGFDFPIIVSPTAIVDENVSIGKGTIIRDNALISISSKIGCFSIIGTSVNINHDTIIGNYVNISLGSNVGMNVNIGNDILIGMGSTIMNYKIITDKCLIGAGSVVIKDCITSGIYFGNPAEKKKEI